MHSLDNAYLNDILCYISTSRLSLSHEDIILNSVAFYKENAIKEAKEAGTYVNVKRINKQPREAHTVKYFGKEPETVAPIPYEFII